MKNLLRQVYKHMMAISAGLLFLLNPTDAEAKSRPTPFKDYRYSLSGGLGFSPATFTANKKYYYPPLKTIKPNIKLEYSISPSFGFSLGLQHEQYQYNFSPKIGYRMIDNSYQRPENYSVASSADMYSIHFDIRKYTIMTGSFAPFGRYMIYGFSITRSNIYEEASQFTLKDNINGDLLFTMPAQSYHATTTGLRFGFGKKKYLGKHLKNFLEYQCLFDINLVPPQSLSYKTAMKLSQNSSILQFTCNYGFSF